MVMTSTIETFFILLQFQLNKKKNRDLTNDARSP